MRLRNSLRFNSDKRGPSRRRSASAGFTLIELLLVLGVLAVIVAVAWPSVIRLNRQQSLLDASDKVRSVAASARVHSIESGLVWQFRYEPGGHHFIIVPFEREFEAINPNAKGGGVVSGLGRYSGASGTLPTAITFASGGTTANSTNTSASTAAVSSGQHISSDVLAKLPDGQKLAGVGWSGPILFHPNGSAGDAVVDLTDRHGQHVTMRIRGVTGAVSLSRLHVQGKK